MTGPTKKSSLRSVLVLPALLLFAACGRASDESAAHSPSGLQQWALPDSLREISGLALTGDDRLLAVNDEEAIVYEIDYDDGRLVKAFALGEPTLRGDFEGIAVLGGRVWLMTSDGVLYVADEGGDGERVAYQRYVTKLGDKCELEGLAEIQVRGTLALLCAE